MNIRLIQVDGKIPNLALMRLSSYHKSRGDGVVLTPHVNKDLFEPEPDIVYASSIFKFSEPKRIAIKKQWPDVVMGGTGVSLIKTIEDHIGQWEDKDYSIYPDYEFSIGFSQRGCRLRCGFCVVPQKEGRPVFANTIHEIWRGEKYPKNIVLLDNDFFGQPNWQERAEEIVDGGFKVSFNQGINIRLIHKEGCKWLAKIKYYNGKFTSRRIYMAWDNLKDEKIFFNGVGMLIDHGIKPNHIMVYMLIGYDPDETWDRIFYRFNKMLEIGVLPYPMVYENKNKLLKRFQKWVVMRYHKIVAWEDFAKKQIHWEKING